LHLKTWQLEAEKQHVHDVMNEVRALKARVAELTRENLTLLKHKKILVTEVKSLKKYSTVNIMGLAQEANEARMMQNRLMTMMTRYGSRTIHYWYFLLSAPHFVALKKSAMN
jgi:hypothetical protein